MYGAYTPNQILLKLIDFYKRENPPAPESHIVSNGKSNDGRGIVVNGNDDLLVRVARCCSPVPGDNIIGYISRGRGVTIHRTSCPNIKNAESFRLIEAHWNSKCSAPFSVLLSIECKDSGGVLASITKTVSDMKLSIETLTARVVDKDRRALISLGLRVTSPEQLELIVGKIRNIRDVSKVYRAMK